MLLVPTTKMQQFQEKNGDELQINEPKRTLILSVHCVIPVRPRTYTSIHLSIQQRRFTERGVPFSPRKVTHGHRKSLCGERETQSVNGRDGTAAGSD